MPEIASSAVPASDDTLFRGRLLWLLAAPAAAAALLFAVTAGYLWAGGADRSDLVLIVAFLAGVVVLTVAAGQSVSTVRRIEDRSAPLQAEVAGARAQADLALEQLETARTQLDTARAEAATARADLADARAEGTAALTEAAGYRAAVTDARAEIEALSEQVRLAEERPVPARTSAGRQVEVFVNLSRRLQSLVHREIKLLDALENEVEDPDLLKGLFQVDHLATRIRRHAENLAVLGGAVSRRQWSRPVALTEVLRSAIAEVEHYSRVKLVPPIEGTVPGHAVASIIHLVAELIENATMFAPPQTQVLLRAQHVTAGVVVEVEDRGLGMQREDQERVNRLLLNPEDINLDDLLRDGRIGLFVVSMIARQHGVTVQLQGNIYGGTQAVIILPQHLLGSAQQDREPVIAPNASVPNALTQQTMELAQRIPGPSQIAAPPPTWPAFTAVPEAPVPAPITATPASAATTTAASTPAAPMTAAPISVAPTSAVSTPSPSTSEPAMPATSLSASSTSATSTSATSAAVSALPLSATPTSGPASPSAPTPEPASAPTPEPPSAPARVSAMPAPDRAPASHSPAPDPTPHRTSGAAPHPGPGPAPLNAPSPAPHPGPSPAPHPVAHAGGSASQSGTLGIGDGAVSGASAFGHSSTASGSEAFPAQSGDLLAVPQPTEAEATKERSAVSPPPLPRRHSQTHLAPQLQFGPPPPPADDDGEHDPALMASFMHGVSRGEAGPPAAPEQH